MDIIEYKRHLLLGVVQDPEFVVSGGAFYNPDDMTWVGTALPESERQYYIPDTIVYLSDEGLHARVLAIHAKYPFTRLAAATDPNAGSVPLTTNEVRSMVDSWIAVNVSGA